MPTRPRAKRLGPSKPRSKAKLARDTAATVTLGLRVSRKDLARVERVAVRLRELIPGSPLNVSGVARAAMLRGVALYEAEARDARSRRGIA